MNKTFIRSALAILALAAPLALAQQTPSKAMTTDCKAVLKTKVNLNTAKLNELMCLPGVNKTVAADLIKERPFKDEKDFLNRIEGGRKLWISISPYVTLK
jgi:DNA uptake protein ComE-like DNA-binding protein